MYILAIIVGLCIAGCATAQSGRLITPEQAAWIERGMTTRAELVTKFGAPRYEIPMYSPGSFSTETTTSTATQPDGSMRVTNSTTEVRRAPWHTKATYLYTRSEAAVVPFYANVHTQQSQFWVEYDGKGVVQDYGFMGDTIGNPR
jgi:hypothetical protein